MNNFFPLIALIFISISCNQERSINIDMSDEKLIALIQDLHISNAAVLKYRTENRDSVAQILKLEMANIHNISIEKIDFVMEQIQKTPKKYLAIEKQAATNIKTLKDSLKISPVIKTESTTKQPKSR